ncbi:hypothetical protein P154DRAFT_574128 [Amniculicola lignicola CBS 123094]|uniref:DUF7730 domain-containing protein n=1 Tax=Amniculicola lignicola CBS 123094 TaxID=1392246 RepID=A0A6A5WLG1_9PLEO|nr:hypothetical protein P154DRAFT_574128 [Amniculicola lignicola CBS 123094]
MRHVNASSIAVGLLCGPFICAYIVFTSCCCPGRLRRSSDCDEKKKFERRQMMAPKPLAVRPLEHSLTIPVPDFEKTRSAGPKRGKTAQQLQCKMMSLPLELREMIYKALLGNDTMHIVLKETKLGHLRCKASTLEDCPVVNEVGSPSRESCWGHTDSANIITDTCMSTGGKIEPTDGDILPLLQTCRQIYSEAIPILYKTNTFSFNDLDSLRHFTATILPVRLSLIRSITLEWCMTWPIYDVIAQTLLLSNPALYPPNDEATWEESWRIIATMPGLQKLRVRLFYFEGFRNSLAEMAILAPLMEVKTPSDFVVTVNWLGEDVEGAPFVLVRPEVDMVDEEDAW